MTQSKLVIHSISPWGGIKSNYFSPGFTTPKRQLDGAVGVQLLKPVDGRFNLKFPIHSLVEKILMDNSNRAYAVHYRRHGRIHIVRARKEIVLCAVGFPQILMLSRIGRSWCKTS
jgi:choline dehydrogenase